MVRNRNLLAAFATLLLTACSVGDCPATRSAWMRQTSIPAATRVSLDTVCVNWSCPTNLKGGLAQVARDLAAMPGACDVQLVSGCGFDSVKAFFGTYADAWYFDHKTGKLVGADHLEDTEQALGACRNLEYTGGSVPPPCANATQRSLCPGDAGTAADAGDAPLASAASKSAEDAGSR